MRRNSRSLIIYLIFGILIAVFILSFGPQTGRSARGGACASPTQAVAKVGGRDISESSWRFALLLMGFGSNASGQRARQARIRERVMDGLIERELLAQAAEKQGFRLTNDEVESRIAKGEMYVLGQRLPGQAYYFAKEEDNIEPHFDFKRLERFATGEGLASVDEFIEEQRREMLAQRMRDLLTESVRVSPDEVKELYIEQNSSVTVDFVKFDPARLRDTMTFTDADVAAYAAAHEADLKKQYEADKGRYTGTAKSVRLRHIFFAKSPEAPPGGSAIPDPQRAKAEAALAKIKGGADFAQVAREMSEDERSKNKGGDLGWRPVAALGWGAELAAAVDKLEPGAPPKEVIETPRGYHVVRVEGRREGDLTFDQVKLELAERAARDEKAKAAAKEAADKALADAQAGQPLDKLFPVASDDEDETTPAKPEDADKPKLVKGAEIHRNGITLAGGAGKYIGRSAELTKALFQELKPDSLGPKVYEVDGAYVIVRLAARTDPDMAKLADEKASLTQTLVEEKAYRLLESFRGQQCTASKDDISVVKQYVEYSEVDDKTGERKTLPVTYQPCASDNPVVLGGGSPIELEP